MMKQCETRSIFAVVYSFTKHQASCHKSVLSSFETVLISNCIRI